MSNFSIREENLIYEIAEKLTGTCQQGRFKKEILSSSVAARMKILNIDSLNKYLNYVRGNEREYGEFISALTIHTTSWFRERNHFINLEKHIRKNIKDFLEEEYVVKCIPASTGQEVYSLGIVLESIKQDYPSFRYRIKGEDIDPVSINTAKNAVYPLKYFKEIPSDYNHFLVKGKGRVEGFFTVVKRIRENCSFAVGDLTQTDLNERKKYDLIFCRNCLIYFGPDDVAKIIDNLRTELKDNGLLSLGHSEAIIDPKVHKLEKSWSSTYRRISKNPTAAVAEKKKILVVDDSASVRMVFVNFLRESGFEPFEAESAKAASEMLKKVKIDLITLDLNMPGKNGDVWLKEQRKEGLKTPVIIVTEAHVDDAQGIFDILENGAEDYLKKSEINRDKSLIIEKILTLISERTKKSHTKEIVRREKQGLFRPEFILIGASTGGTEALTELLKDFPKDCPPVFVVQHITASFATAFAERLSRVSGIPLGKFYDGVTIEQGKLYMASDDYHIGIRKMGGTFKFVNSKSAPVNRHRPSVDFLFNSATNFASRCAGVLLTGMGSDGANGLFALKHGNAITFCQDEESSVVYGMPKEAISLGAAGFVGNIREIRQKLNEVLRIKKSDDKKKR